MDIQRAAGASLRSRRPSTTGAGDDGLLYGLDDYDVDDVLRSTSRYAYDEHDRVIRQDVDDDADGTLDEVWTQTWWGALLVADVAEWRGEVVLTRWEPLGLDHEPGMPLTSPST